MILNQKGSGSFRHFKFSKFYVVIVENRVIVLLKFFMDLWNYVKNSNLKSMNQGVGKYLTYSN